MNRIGRSFSKGKAFIPFVTAGDPTIEVTEQLVYKMAQAGADMIELGIPFSDPVAEGETIQAADKRALEGGVTVEDVFSMMLRVRRICDIPVALMTYVNPVFVYGAEKFMMKSREAGIDAIIVPDLPFEERDELEPYCSKYGIALISMIAPTSEDRIRMIAEKAQGFIYCVSSMGVTGVRNSIGTEVTKMIRQVKEVSDIPCAAGFGISTPEQAAEIAGYADGVIVGSAIVKLAESYGAACVPHIEEYVRNMKKAVTR